MNIGIPTTASTVASERRTAGASNPGSRAVEVISDLLVVIH
jgi:hypothetical protein